MPFWTFTFSLILCVGVKGQDTTNNQSVCPHECQSLPQLSLSDIWKATQNDLKFEEIQSDLAIMKTKLDDLAVIKTKLDDIAIIKTKLDDLAVMETKLDDLAVMKTMLDDLAVNRTKLDDFEIMKAKLDDLAVIKTKLDDLAIIKKKLDDLAAVESSGEILALPRTNKTCDRYPTDCQEVVDNGNIASGVYTIQPRGIDPFDIFCQVEYVHGKGYQGSNVIQSRFNGQVSFNRSWAEYKQGFGDLNGEFWLGNDKIYAFSTQGLYSLRVETIASNVKSFTYFDHFYIHPEANSYALYLSGYSGKYASEIATFSGKGFTTYDRDNDNYSGINCGEEQNGGWWHLFVTSCFKYGMYSLNGVIGCTDYRNGCTIFTSTSMELHPRF